MFKLFKQKKFSLYKPALVILFLIIFILPLGAETSEDNFRWSVSGSLLYFAANNGADSDPAPILPSLGFSFSWKFWGPLRIELTEDLYFTNYQYNSVHGYPMACNQAERSAFVFGFLTGVQLKWIIDLEKKDISIRVYGGPAADFRIITLAFGLKHPSDFEGGIETNVKLQTDAIFNYFWGKGRWLMPVLGAGMDFPVSENFLIGFDLRVWFPVYKIWANDNTPAIDGWRFGAGLRITPRKNSQ